jgi:SAM-dependent methyltransferase
MTEVAVLPASNQVGIAHADRRVTVLRDKWNEHADEWIAWVRDPGHPDSYWRFHRERFLALVPDPGLLTLDIGCGEGRVGRDLQKLGHKVVGVDWSATMCKAATTHWETPTRAIVGDAARLPIADATADCAIAFMSLQDIDDMHGAIKEIARVLKDGKKLALAIVHPMYSNGRFTTAGSSGGDFVIRRSYFQRQLCVSQDGQDGMKVTFFREHRPLEAYIEALIAAGFNIEQLHEVTEDDQNNLRHRIPMFLDILASRRPREKAPVHRLPITSYYHG